ELNAAESIMVAGSGFYHAAALHSARLLRRFCGKEAMVVEPDHASGPVSDSRKSDAAVAVLSGSQCRLKRELHQFAASLRRSVPRILAITDGADRDLIDASSLAVLLPPSGEMTGCLLALVAVCGAVSQCCLQRNAPAADANVEIKRSEKG